MKTRHSLDVVKPRRKRAEQAFHIEAVNFCRMVLPQAAMVIHVPNEGKRSAIAGQFLKAMGMLAGFPDILILFERRAFTLECKSDTGTLEPEQRACHALLQSAGVPVETVRTIEEVYHRLEQFGLPVRGVKFQGKAHWLEEVERRAVCA